MTAAPPRTIFGHMPPHSYPQVTRFCTILVQSGLHSFLISSSHLVAGLPVGLFWSREILSYTFLPHFSRFSLAKCPTKLIFNLLILYPMSTPPIVLLISLLVILWSHLTPTIFLSSFLSVEQFFFYLLLCKRTGLCPTRYYWQRGRFPDFYFWSNSIDRIVTRPLIKVKSWSQHLMRE